MMTLIMGYQLDEKKGRTWLKWYIVQGQQEEWAEGVLSSKTCWNKDELEREVVVIRKHYAWNRDFVSGTIIDFKHDHESE